MESHYFQELFLAMSGFFGENFKRKTPLNACENVDDPDSQSTKTSKNQGRLKTSEIVFSENFRFFHSAESEILETLCKIGSNFLELRGFIEKNCLHSLLFTQNFGRPSPSAPGPDPHQKSRGLYLAALVEGLNTYLDQYRSEIAISEKEIQTSMVTSGEHVRILLRIHSQFQHFERIFSDLTDFLIELENLEVEGFEIINLVFWKSRYPTGQAYRIILDSCHKVLCHQLSSWLSDGEISGDPFQEFFIQQSLKEVEDDFSSPKSISSEYYIRKNFVPSYFSENSIKQILLIGNSVKLFCSEEFLQKFSSSDSEKFIDNFRNRINSELGQSFFQENSSFESSRLGMTLNRLEAEISREMWDLVVKKCDLMSEFDLLNRVFFLGDGELILYFLDLIDQSKLNLTDFSDSNLVEVNRIFCQAAQLLDKGNMLSRVSLACQPHRTGKELWEVICINYVIPWPLHLVISGEILEKMNELFRFLLQLRRTKLRLGQVWKELKGKTSKDPDVTLRIWQLRSFLIHVVDALQYYLCVAVLNASFLEFQKSLEKLGQRHSPDFSKCQLAVHDYIKKVSTRSCQESDILKEHLGQILAVCDAFCDSILLERCHNLASKLQELYVKFQKQCSVLYRLLDRISQQEKNIGIEQLVLELDFNYYFSNALIT